MRQLALPFSETSTYAAEDFCAGTGNLQARQWLDRPAEWTNGRLVLWGETSCGKTHLLHVWAAAAQASLLHGTQLRGPITPPARPVAIDDADAIADEAAVLHILNAAAEAGQPVLLASRVPPGRQNFALADLASRLRASSAVEISAPDDAMLATLLARWAAERQLELSFQVSHFLLTRLPRTPAAMREAVARLDHAALAAGGKITRNLAAALLADIALVEPAGGLLSNRHSPAAQNLL